MRTNNRIQLGFVYYESYAVHIHKKIFESRAIVEAALERAHKPYIAFSGGKDALVTAAMVHSFDPTVPLCWGDDELEFPEVVAMMTSLRDNIADRFIPLLSNATHAGWFTAWSDEPFWREPLAGSIVLPKKARVSKFMRREFGFDLTFLGTRGAESTKRAQHFDRHSATYNTGTGLRCCPLASWSNDDIWAVIATHNMPYCPVYDVLDRLRVADHRWRLGPLPLVPQQTLEEGWPDMYEQLTERYGENWS